MTLVSNYVGAPTNCHEVLKYKDSTAIFAQARVGENRIFCSMGTRDFDATFIGSARELGAVRVKVKGILQSPPFNLQVAEQRGDIVGVRRYLSSGVLAGWREWTTVRVQLEVGQRSIGTTISTTLLVSKQASADREAWSPASEPQEEVYLSRLRHQFARSGGTVVL